jgi:hypothetical protein
MMTDQPAIERVDDKLLNVIGMMSLDDVLDIVQRSLIQIRAMLSRDEYAALGVQVKSADLELETMLGAELGFEAKVAVVTVTGGAAAKATTTLSLSLRSKEPTVESFKLFDPVSQIVTNSEAMFETLVAAGAPGGHPLELNESSIKFVLVISAEGKLEVAPVGWWEKLLEILGIDFSASVAAEWVRTSTITINFMNAADADDGGGE